MQPWSHYIFKRCNTRWLPSEQSERYLRHTQRLSATEFLNNFCQWPRFSGLLASQKPQLSSCHANLSAPYFCNLFFKSTEAKAPKGRHRQDGNLFFRLEIEQTNISTSVLEYIWCPCILSDTMQGYGMAWGGGSCARVQMHFLYHKYLLKISQLKILYLTFQNDECL